METIPKNENLSINHVSKENPDHHNIKLGLKDITNTGAQNKKNVSVFNSILTNKTQKTDVSDDINSTNKHQAKIRALAQKVDKIRFHYQEKGVLYEDEEFPPLDKMLFKTEEELEGASQFMKNWEWMRPETIFPKTMFFDAENQYNTELRFGPFSSTNFINAIATLTDKGQIERVFVDIDNLDMGYAIFQFFKNGEWVYVLIDTQLPFSRELKRFLFSHNGSFEIMWLALLEKAYAKLHNNYGNIRLLSFRDILVDMSSCHLEKIRFKDPDNDNLISSKKLFSQLGNYLTSNQYILVCSNRNKKEKTAKAELGEYGIARNLVHAITACEDVTGKDFKFLRIRNFWGAESNWSGPFSNNSDEWEKYKSLRDDLLNSKKYFNDTSNKYFMRYDDFIKEFNTLYIIRLFDPEMFKTYSVRGVWQDKTAAGGPTDLEKRYPPENRFQHEFTRLDSDDSWFNNPQYRIKISKKTKIFISLVQHDDTYEGNRPQYVPVDFYLVKNPLGFQRVWEFPKEDNIILHANKDLEKRYSNPALNLSQVQKSQLLNSNINLDNTGPKIKRELSKHIMLKPEGEKKYGNYNIIVSLKKVKKKSTRVPFYLRVHANEEIIIEKLPETIEQTITGSWETKTAGGPHYPNKKGLGVNPNWCLNPQYLLTFQQPTYVKIILTKTGKNAKKTKNSKLGLSFLHAALGSKNVRYFEREKSKPQRYKNKKEETKAKILEKALDHLKVPYLSRLERKIKVVKEEKFNESSFASTEIACLYLKVLPIEGPLLIVPSLDQSGACCDFKITLFSSADIVIDVLDETKNAAILSKWSQYNAGGSHVYTEEFSSRVEKRTWATNPLFVLKFTDFEHFNPNEHKVTVRLSICEPNWKAKLLKSEGPEAKKNARRSKLNVCSMICLYILRPSKRLSLQDIVYQTAFVPGTYLEYDLFYNIERFDGEDEIYIMPATYSSGIEGKFILSAYCESPISLKAL